MLEPGTIIKIKSATKINETLNANKCCKKVVFVQDMYAYCGCVCSITGYNHNNTYTVKEFGPHIWNWLPEWFDVIDAPNGFWNNGSKKQRSLCLALYRQALSGNIPWIEKLGQDAPTFKIREKGGFNYISFLEDDWGNGKIAGSLPDWKWLDINPRILERALVILYNARADFKILERNPNSPELWFDGLIMTESDSTFVTDFINKYLGKPIKTIEHENQLQRKKSNLVRGTVPERNIICGRKRKASVSIGHLSNKICSGI